MAGSEEPSASVASLPIFTPSQGPALGQFLLSASVYVCQVPLHPAPAPLGGSFSSSIYWELARSKIRRS